MSDRPPFNRRLHLGLALVALLHGPILARASVALPSIMGTAIGPEFSAVVHLMHLCLAAFVAWLAFAVFDTRSGVTIWPNRWRDLGWRVPAVFILAEIVLLVPMADGASQWPLVYVDSNGDLAFGWLVVAMTAGSAAEELVYRVLLQRGLEGYTPPWCAIAIQALVFQFVHVHVYGYAHHAFGLWFFAGVLYGYAFHRTRSLAAPTLLHTAHNVLFFSLLWHFSR